MRRLFPWLSLVAAAALGGCTQLPDIAHGTCGNGVVDANEDCDTYAPSGQACRAPGTSGECRLDCATGHACPTGWGCGTDAVCRLPSGGFSPVAITTEAGGQRLFSADFDMDGRKDVLTLAPGDIFGAGPARVQFFDDGGRVQQTFVLAKPIAKPVLRDLSGDGHPDIVGVLGIGGIATFLGSSGRDFTAVPYPSIPVPKGVRLVPIVTDIIPAPAGQANAGDEFAVAIEQAGAVMVSYEDVPFFTIPNAKVDQLLRPVPRGRFDPSYPCEALVLTAIGQKSVSIVSPCDKAGKPVNAASAKVTTLSFPLGSVLNAATGDGNGDGKLDIFVATEGVLHVGYGDGKGTFFPSPDLKGPADTTLPVMLDGDLPLGAADFDGDGALDLVSANGVYLAAAGKNAVPAIINFGKPWTQAIVQDFDGSGTLDVMLRAEGAPGLTLVLSDGKGGLTRAGIPTVRNVQHMVSGDFDANQVADVAIGLRSESDTDPDGDTPDTVEVVFGEKGGVPSGTVRLGEFGKILDLSAGRAEGGASVDGATDLGVSWFASAGSDQEKIAVAFGAPDRFLTAPFLFRKAAYAEGGLPLGLAVGQLGGDATLDLCAVASTFADGDETGAKATTAVWSATSLGAGELADPKKGDGLSISPVVDLFGMGVGAVPVTTADLDGDGLDEVVVAYAKPGAKESEVFVLGMASGQAALVSKAKLPAQIERTQTPLVFDVDGDGKLDLVALTGNPRDARDVIIAWGTGVGFDEVPTTLSPPGRPLTGLAAKRDASGTRLYVSSGKRAFEIRATGRDLRIEPLDFTEGSTDVAMADVNGDGIDDLVLLDDGILRVHLGKAVRP